MWLQYFIILASFLILINSEGLVPPLGRSYYQLQHPNKGELSFTMNFVTTSNKNRAGFFHFVVGNEKPCVFKLQFDIDTNILSIALNKYGDYEGEEIRIDLKNVEEKIEISYFDNQLYFNGTVVTMKCGIEWMLLDKDTDVIDVLIDNNEQHPTDMNITWNNFIKYYDPTSNSTESEDSTVKTIAPLKNAEFSTTLKYFSTTIKVESPSPPETAGANVGVAVALGIGGFLLGCIIGTGSIIGYLYFMKNKSKSNVKTVVTSKSYTTPLRRDGLDSTVSPLETEAPVSSKLE